MGAGDMEGVAVWLRIGKAVKPGLVRLFQNMASMGQPSVGDTGAAGTEAKKES